MLSTMQDVPLLISRILTHGSTVHGTSQVISWTGEGEPERRSFKEIGDRSAQLAHALREELGVVDGERTATLMWNNAVHVEAYFAIPAMGRCCTRSTSVCRRSSWRGSSITRRTG